MLQEAKAFLKYPTLKPLHNTAKEKLAYEVTMLIHGKDEADKALSAAKSLFGGAGNSENMPSTKLDADMFADGEISVIDLLAITKLAPSKGEARRLIQQGGVCVDDVKITEIGAKLSIADFEKGYVVIKKGKKAFHKAEL